MAGRKPMCFGNLVFAERGDLVEVTLNTDPGVRPHALFQRHEIPKLAEIAASFGPAKKESLSEEEALEIEDLI